MSTSDRWACVALVLAVGACTVFDEELQPPAPQGDCTRNAECIERLGGPAMCVKGPAEDALPHCALLTSEDCTVVTGDPSDDRAVLIASLLSTTGAQAATNVPRQQAAMMAVEEINATNASGGILQTAAPGDTRKLVMVSCDEVANLPRVATHLLEVLHVAAIVGPNLSQDVLDLTIGNPSIGLPSSANAGTALLTPTAVASAIATVPDNGLTYMMVPSDIQRVPLMKARINQVEAQVKAARSKTTIKIGIYYRNDALGEGTRDGLGSLTINGGTLANAINQGKARIDSYEAASTDNTALVASYVQFQPDIVIVVGAAESVKYFVVPLEAAWPAGMPRPYYIGIDSNKVPELLAAATGNDDLRVRWSGTGITTTTETQPVLSAFQVAYGQRWKDAQGNPLPATQSGMAPAYDAVYAVSLALVGVEKVTARAIADNLPRLASHKNTCTYDATGIQPPCFTVTDHARTLYNNMSMLLASKQVLEIGTSGRLEWDAQGAKSNGAIEIWCINATGPKPIFASSGLTYDVKAQAPNGSYVQCGP